MCGRFVVSDTTPDLIGMFDVEVVGDNLPGQSWNVAPTDPVIVIIDSLPKNQPEHPEPVRRAEAARWGLVPSWAKDPSVGSRMFNARIEEAAEKSSFRNSVAKRRAAIPATGYYEWRRGPDGVKYPQFIHAADGRPLLLAGLYEWWRNPAAAEDAADKWLLSATILTTDSAGELASIHDRMPVVLDHGFLDEWLDPYLIGDRDLLAAIAESAKTGVDELAHYEVGRAVGSVKNNGPQLIDPVAEDEAEPEA
ncbi:SOS response-associated peptidase [Diaminobutyricimonas sp. LJ205]|uniref:SOS response-associated peptidase n=1 Tax=Diaminobutyricimonas sp. LJ205 TaxID=2683590 RepID=UPI0012F4AF62|nr:SOS response-associated peptidase [Diaminobutyricimonas sp. LJ205]